MNRIRWLILILGPLPIVGSSWALSAWFRSEPRTEVVANSVLPSAGETHVSAPAPEPPALLPEGLPAECAATEERVTAALGEECHVFVRPPFIVAGDLEHDELAALYDETIAPAVRALRNCYFEIEPNRPVTVLVFRGEQSYNRYCEKLFGDRGISIYGYYKPNMRTLVLNIGTGRGTLLHELTHALIDFDFPDAPDWLNEGLASLHEQSQFCSDDRGPRIEGLVNWRLKGLQEVTRRGQLGSLGALFEHPKFRGPQVGTNYAQARYFCMYLQEKGVLADLYREVRANQARGDRGRLALAKVLPDVTLEQLNADFQAWVLTLTQGG